MMIVGSLLPIGHDAWFTLSWRMTRSSSVLGYLPPISLPRMMTLLRSRRYAICRS